MITLNAIREKLKDAIKNSGMTQAEICRRVNIKSSTIAQYLSGRAMPALDTFAKLCAVLDLDANEVLCVGEYSETE
ncbi:MAG: helix-turn-helix domain-containing protein [Clostridia bacterium]|nr:helix-turn-helix domain-containing protein [Clostridia bacterium]